MNIRNKDIKKILIIKLAAIGDVMFASPLVENLKSEFGDAQIHWLGESWTKSVLDNIPQIDKVYYYDRPKKNGTMIKSYLNIVPLLWRLKSESYDLAIIPHRSKLAFGFAKLSNIKYKVGFVESTPSNLLDVSVSYDSSKHEIERNLDLLRAIGIRIKTNNMVFEIDEAFDKNAKERLSIHKDSRKIICIAPGGGKNPGLSMPLKRWPKESCVSLIKELISLDMRVVLIGSADDNDVCDYISTNTMVENFCAKTSLEESAAIIKNSNLYIGNDSGLLYIASAMGVPTIGIFGPTDAKLLAPLSENSSYVTSNAECSPCYHPQSTVQGKYESCENNQECLTQLAATKVLKEVGKLLK